MNIFGERAKDIGAIISFNTGTLYDLMSGGYIRGYDGRWYLNGGLGNYISSAMGPGNSNKSTLENSLMMCVLANYPETHGFCLDNEGAQSGERIRSFLNSPLHGPNHEDPKSRYHLSSIAGANLEYFEKDFNDIANVRKTNGTKLEITVPHMLNGEPIKFSMPTWYFLDSWSEGEAEASQEKVDKQGASDSKSNDVAMQNGRVKSILLPKLLRKCQNEGISLQITIREGDESSRNSLPSFMPKPKELTHGRPGKKAKDAGSKTTTLIHMSLLVYSCKQAMKDEPAYPISADTPATDIMVLDTTSIRNKLAPSGIHVPFIVSQSHGLLTDVTNLHFLLELKTSDNGIKGSGTYRCMLYPDVTFTRKTIFEKAKNDYKLARALELTARYYYIKNNWSTAGMNIPFDKTMEQIRADAVSKGLNMDDILETTSIWHPNFKKSEKGQDLGAHDRVHLTLLEFLEKVYL